jgi:endonuclease-3
MKRKRVEIKYEEEQKINFVDGHQEHKEQDVKLQEHKQSPPNWETVYQLIDEFRKNNQAEVDTMGCATLADHGESQPIFRYHILTSLQLSSQTKDPVTAQAIKNLQNHPGGLNPRNVSQMDDRELNGLISKVGFHNRKTQ